MTPELNAEPNSPSRDGTLKLRREMEGGHVQLSALLRSFAAFLPDGRHEAVVGWGFNFADAAAKAGEKGGAYSGAEEISPGVWVYQITKNGLALQATLQGTKYYKDDDLNKK